MINVKNNGEFASTTSYSWHKGFYKETNFENVLYDIKIWKITKTKKELNIN